MRIDLFELIEGLFRGIVYFIYNVVETIATIIRHPIKGPMQLHRRYLRREGRQIGGLTFLFLTISGFFWISVALTLLSYDDQERATDLSDRVSNNVGLIQTDRLWVFVLGSLIATVIIDSALRLVLRWRLPSRASWRALMLASAEYSMLWIALIAFVIIKMPLGEQWSPILSIGLPIAAIPAAKILTRATRRTRKPSKRAEVAWHTGWAIILVVLFGIAIMAGIGVSTYISTLSDARAAAPVRIQTLDCRVVQDGTVEAFGLITLRGGGPRTIAPSDFRLEIYSEPSWDKRMTLNNPIWADADTSSYLVVSPGGAQLIHLRFAASQTVPGETECRLTPSGIQRDTSRPPVRFGPG